MAILFRNEGALGQDGNHMPMHNSFFPKAPKKLRGSGDFYGDIQTQKELKVPKPKAPPAEPPASPAPAETPPAAAAPPAPAQTAPPAPVSPPSPPAPTQNAVANYPKAQDKLKGDFYGDLNRDLAGTHPLNNNFYPKAPKKLVGDFYGELKTQKELKIPKKKPAPELARPEEAMKMIQQQPGDAAKAVPAAPVPDYTTAASQQ